MSSSDDEAPEEVSNQHGEADASVSRRSEREGKRAATQQTKSLRSSSRQQEAAASTKVTGKSDVAGARARASEANAVAAGSSKAASQKKQKTQEAPAETTAAAVAEADSEGADQDLDLLPDDIIAAVAVNAAEKAQHQKLLAQAVLEGQETAKEAEQRRRKRDRRAAAKLAQSKGIGKIAVKVLSDVAKEGTGGLAGNFLRQSVMDSSRPRSINMIKPGLKGLRPAARFA